MASVHLAKPYIGGQSQPGHAGLWLGWQVMVFLFLAFMWQTPEHHWRMQLSPRSARQRAWLAVKLWGAQCLRVLPLFALLPVVASPWMLAWPWGISDGQAMRNAAVALPWLIANGALTLAAVTLWVGIRRAQLGWDLVPLGVAIGMMLTGLMAAGTERAQRLDWAGRWDVLSGLVLGTTFLLALACWAWSRGSLTGMERWGAIGRHAKR